MKKKAKSKKQEQLTTVVLDDLLEVLERTPERSIGFKVLEVVECLQKHGIETRDSENIASELVERIGENGFRYPDVRVSSGIQVNVYETDIHSIHVYESSPLYKALIEFGEFEVLVGSAPPGTWGRDFRIFRYGKLIGCPPMYAY